MSYLPRPPVQLSEKALLELKTILVDDIGGEALKKLSEAEINHIGCFLLTLTSIQLDVSIREHQNSVDSL